MQGIDNPEFPREKRGLITPTEITCEQHNHLQLMLIIRERMCFSPAQCAWVEVTNSAFRCVPQRLIAVRREDAGLWGCRCTGPEDPAGTGSGQPTDESAQVTATVHPLPDAGFWPSPFP